MYSFAKLNLSVMRPELTVSSFFMKITLFMSNSWACQSIKYSAESLKNLLKNFNSSLTVLLLSKLE